jgi:tetratricopeptide (TPR) repeat protein
LQAFEEVLMPRRASGRPYQLSLLASLAVLTAASLAAAQSTGGFRGKVIDDKGRPVEGARIAVELADGPNGRQETTTNAMGEFALPGLTPGNYRITADKSALGSQSFEARVRIAQAAEVNFQLLPAWRDPSKEDAAIAVELRKIFNEAVEASRLGNFDDAIAGFENVLESIPSCADCLYDVGHAYAQKKEYDKAEAAFRRALDMNPDDAEAYVGLADIYSAQRKFDQASAATGRAAELVSGTEAVESVAAALYNQGAILWSIGKVAEARKQFEAAIQADPNRAESHYWLGMTLVNEGRLERAAIEFEASLALAPEGPTAAKARELLAQLKRP